MRPWQSRLCPAVAALALASACSNTPSAPSVSFSGPLALQPVNGTTYSFFAQPITLTITNAAKTGDAAVTYSVDVATDSAFTSVVFTKDAIAEGSGGTTAVPLTSLTGGVTYYWRCKTVIDGVVGPPSVARSFTVLPALNPPVAVSPSNGGTANSLRPTFTVTNATRTGPVGAVTYEFQVSTSASFSPITASATVAEQATRTSWASSTELPERTPLFWRARAKDSQSNGFSDFSPAAAFTIRLFDLSAVTWVNNPNLANWAETTKITSIDFSSGHILVDFDKRSGPDQWPPAPFGDGSNDPVQYTLGMCFNLGGKWFCSAVIQFWPGRDLDASGPASNVAIDWYYDKRWGPMAGHQPDFGEQVGIFVVNGNVRDSLSWAIEQRSDIVVVPFGTNYVR